MKKNLCFHSIKLNCCNQKMSGKAQCSILRFCGGLKNFAEQNRFLKLHSVFNGSCSGMSVKTSNININTTELKCLSTPLKVSFTFHVAASGTVEMWDIRHHSPLSWTKIQGNSLCWDSLKDTLFLEKPRFSISEAARIQIKAQYKTFPRASGKW